MLGWLFVLKQKLSDSIAELLHNLATARRRKRAQEESAVQRQVLEDLLSRRIPLELWNAREQEEQLTREQLAFEQRNRVAAPSE